MKKIILLAGLGSGLKLTETKCIKCKVKEKFIIDENVDRYDAYYPSDMLAQMHAAGTDVSNFKDIESHSDGPTVSKLRYILYRLYLYLANNSLSEA